MKLIAIIGSPRGMQGNTGVLVEPILKAAQQEGIATEIYSLADLTVLPCKGCQNVCHVTGTCHQKDDFDKIKTAMLEADGIIFASPNYTLKRIQLCLLRNHKACIPAHMSPDRS